MIPDYSSYSQFIFTASIAAAGLMYAAGSVVMKKKSFLDDKITNKINSSKNLGLKYLYETVGNNICAVYGKLIAIIMLDVLFFLFSNLLILIYWAFPLDMILVVGILLYFFGLILMMVTVVITLYGWEDAKMKIKEIKLI
jgi:hypothetical protein